ncbi:hypothetical protein D3C78_1702980 [compost metagenome]
MKAARAIGILPCPQFCSRKRRQVAKRMLASSQCPLASSAGHDHASPGTLPNRHITPTIKSCSAVAGSAGTRAMK